MANMYCKNQKSNSEEYNKNYNANFKGNRDIPYPEEKRMQEIERVVKTARPIVMFPKVGIGKDSWPKHKKKEAKRAESV